MNVESTLELKDLASIETHLYLVSPHATPNITPALDKSLKPKKVILLVSSQMHAEAKWLSNVLRGHNIEVTQWELEKAWDLVHIRSRVIALLKQWQGEKIALNASCGTKPMTIACCDVFREHDLPVFYIDPHEDELIWVYPEIGGRHPVQDRIKLPQFVQVYGGTVSGNLIRQVPKNLLPFSKALIQDIEIYEKSIGSLNYYASSAYRDLRSKEMDERSLGSKSLKQLLQQLQELGVLHREGNRIVFANEDARFFANGGWLEHYVFDQVSRLRRSIPEIQDVVMGLEVERGDSVKNEIDVAFLADNRLHLIECKAKSFKGSRTDNGTEILYKIDSVSDVLGGIQARSMLVSYKKLSSHDLKRAEELEVTVVQHLQLHNLRSHLEQWIAGRNKF